MSSTVGFIRNIYWIRCARPKRSFSLGLSYPLTGKGILLVQQVAYNLPKELIETGSFSACWYYYWQKVTLHMLLLVSMSMELFLGNGGE
jgi:hypothetical protein